MDVAIGYHRSGRAARRVAADLAAMGARACVIRVDLADPGAARRLAAAARALGGLDVLVNSAARFERTPFATTSLAPIRPRRIAVNCVAPGAVLRPPGFSQARWRKVVRGHSGTVDEVVAAVVFFATCPTYITGQILKVDGAQH